MRESARFVQFQAKTDGGWVCGCVGGFASGRRKEKKEKLEEERGIDEAAQGKRGGVKIGRAHV